MGEYVPREIEHPEPSVSAINVGALRAPTSGDRATGLIVSRLYIGTKSYLVVAVQNAAVLLPPAYLVRIAGYRLRGPIIQGRNISPEGWTWRASCSP